MSVGIVGWIILGVIIVVFGGIAVHIYVYPWYIQTFRIPYLIRKERELDGYVKYSKPNEMSNDERAYFDGCSWDLDRVRAELRDYYHKGFAIND